MANRSTTTDSEARTLRRVRVFISSASDVREERSIAHSVVDRLNRAPSFRDRLYLEIVAWDDPESVAPMLAAVTPQESAQRGLVHPSDCEIVIAIFWGRMGTPLEHPLKDDGSRYASGTEWELEDARRANRDILVYRRTTTVAVAIDDPDFESKRAQKILVDRFFERFDGRYATYNRAAEFETRLESDLQNLLVKLLSSSPQRSPEPLEQTPVPPGEWRLRFAYRAVLERPGRFELLETLDPATLSETMRAMEIATPADAESRFANGAEPNVLWRVWMETVHQVKLRWTPSELIPRSDDNA